MVLIEEERKLRNRMAAARYRANQTPEKNAEHLRKQREYAQSKRQQMLKTKRDRSLKLNISKCGGNGDDMCGVKCVSSDVKLAVLKALQKTIGPEGLEQCVCSVCYRLVLRNTCVEVISSDYAYVDKMQDLLSASEDGLSAKLVNEDDCSNVSGDLAGMFLSRNGIVLADDYVKLRICDECDRSLKNSELPKYAIRNGFYIGALPSDLLESTIVERLMTQVVTAVAFTRVMRGGSHRSIRSHCMAFKATPGPPATFLPCNLGEIECYWVVLAGEFTDLQKAKVQKMHCVRRAMVESLLAFYKNNNSFYESISVNFDKIDEQSVFMTDQMIEAAHLSTEETEMEQDRVAGEGDGGCIIPEEEQEVVERSMVFEERAPSPTENFDSVVEMASESAQEDRCFLVRHSSKHSRDQDGIIYGKMFPHLFPYGQGHPGEQRKIHVSSKACIKHYCALSSRRFGEDPLFVLVAFDRLSVQNMFLQLALKCMPSPDIFEGYDGITPVQLSKALQDNEGGIQGRIAPPRTLTSTAIERF